MRVGWLDMPVGIYDNAIATITRHRTGAVSVSIPYIKERDCGSMGLSHSTLHVSRDDPRANVLSTQIFADGPKEWESLAEFLAYECADIWP